MIKEVKAPNPIPEAHYYVFLAGSIEMGMADKWQDVIVKELIKNFPKHEENFWVILNPRRDDWDSTWEQKKDNPAFRGQVEWELDAMERADKIVMYFDPKTYSPVTMLELGLHAGSDKLIVCCAEGFWRKGNVDIVCERNHIQQVKRLRDVVPLILRG